VALEYTYLLTTQLETQREYFEGELALLNKQKNAQLEQLQKKVEDAGKEKAIVVSYHNIP
jgi:BRCA1-associated protein